MAKIVFCSSVFDMSQYEHLRKKSKLPLGLADHNLNENLIRGIEENINEPVKLINNVQIPVYPNYPKVFFRRQKWSHSDRAEDINCGFINLPVIKHLSRAVCTYKELKKYIKDNHNEEICLMSYDLHFGISMAISKILKKFPGVKSCLFMPDVPLAVLESSSAGRIRLRDKVRARLKSKAINSFGSYVFITKQMAEVVPTQNKDYVVVEGIYNDKRPELGPCYEEKKVILYTGQLNPVYGLRELIEAYIEIAKVYDYYELWLCGGGPMVDEIEQLSKVWPGIRYFGYCSTSEIIEKQKSATVLINPRRNTGEYTKYSFPSKTMEYLASGRPMIGYKLDGIPDEYDSYICYVKGESLEDLKKTIIDVCSMSDEERATIGEKAREFIVKNKNPKAQCRSIVEMLQRL